MDQIFFFNILCIVVVIALSLGYVFIIWCMWKQFVHRPVVRPTADETCFICFERKADITLLPCGHSGQCHVCVQRILRMDRRCPMCRASVAGVLFLMV